MEIAARIKEKFRFRIRVCLCVRLVWTSLNMIEMTRRFTSQNMRNFLKLE